MWYRNVVAALVVLSGCVSVHGQGTVDDYRKAYASRQLFGADKVFYSNVRPSWIEGSDSFWYVRHTPDGRHYAIVDASARRRSDLFDHKRLARHLTSETGREIRPDSIVLQGLRVSSGADTLWFDFNGRQWTYAVRRDRLTDCGAVPPPVKYPHWMVVDEERGAEPVISPDGKHEAYVKDDNIYVRERATGVEKQLSVDGTPGNYYSSYIQWSPDSRKVASCRIRPAQKRYVYYVESSPKDQLQPRLHKQEYAKPGDELRFKVPCIYDVDTGEGIIPSTELFASQYDLTGLGWNDDSRAVTFEYNERGHKVYRVLELSAETGKVRPLVEETSDTYVNYPRYFRHDLSDGKRMIWMSERDNWNHLYMYDRSTGRPSGQITRGEWYVRQVLNVDEPSQTIYFSANGMNTDEDPYNIRYYRIGFDGSGLTDLTPEAGYHTAWFSPDMKYLVDVVSTPTDAPVAVVRDASTGDKVIDLERADISQLIAAGWRAPEVFAAPGRDGETMMWGLIQRPTDFDPSKKYPVIEYIYQGPGDQYVPKTFMPYNHWLTPPAELGFIVVMVDGMSTSFRSKAFENVCYQNLKDAGLPDHMAWLRAAAEKYPYIDIDRVGIYGASAGGQESTNAVLLYPEFYKAAYSACGCHDNRMDKIWWNELWLGYPVGDQYRANSNVENAHLLRRPLMLVVGELDDNVDPASTMQVADALIRANKDFELVVIPGASHTMGEAYGDHKRYDFFVKHLMGVAPPAWDAIDR